MKKPHSMKYLNLFRFGNDKTVVAGFFGVKSATKLGYNPDSLADR